MTSLLCLTTTPIIDIIICNELSVGNSGFNGTDSYERLFLVGLIVWFLYLLTWSVSNAIFEGATHKNW